MKGDTNWIVWLLVVVVAAGVILYLMWSKGIGPFVGSVTEAQCKSKAVIACQSCLQTGKCKDELKNTFVDKYAGCKDILKATVSDKETKLGDVISDDTEAIEWCTSFLEVS
ncbi:MAG: hypothetical protein J7K83_04320 [Candidatus Aenigmarchaeota archaeon]|nr:hypothetical protein [Candidatus Aenigmarchaeota archaeon]